MLLGECARGAGVNSGSSGSHAECVPPSAFKCTKLSLPLVFLPSCLPHLLQSSPLPQISSGRCARRKQEPSPKRMRLPYLRSNLLVFKLSTTKKEFQAQVEVVERQGERGRTGCNKTSVSITLNKLIKRPRLLPYPYQSRVGIFTGSSSGYRWAQSRQAGPYCAYTSCSHHPKACEHYARCDGPNYYFMAHYLITCAGIRWLPVRCVTESRRRGSEGKVVSPRSLGCRDPTAPCILWSMKGDRIIRVKMNGRRAVCQNEDPNMRRFIKLILWRVSFAV